jgi:hypothetical protein
LPEQLAPVGLPDYALWRREAERRAIERPPEVTHELSAPRGTRGRPAPKNRPPAWLALLLLLILGGLGWYFLAPTDSETVDKAQTLTPTQPEITEMVPTPPDAGAENLDSPSPEQHGVTAPPSPTPKLPGQDAHEPRRTPSEGARRKPKAHAPSAPAEVETEWK